MTSPDAGNGEPLTAAWAGAGRPLPDPARGNVATTTAQHCARCAISTVSLTPVRAVISNSFTALDTWTDPGAAGLCAGCSWGYLTHALRNEPHLVTTAPSLETLTPVGLFDLLTVRAPTVPRDPLGTFGSHNVEGVEGAVRRTRNRARKTTVAEVTARMTSASFLPMSVAVTVPMRPGRKHVLPSARWGHVTIDDVPLLWTMTDAYLLTVVAALRGDGMPASTLTAPAPPWRFIGLLDAADRDLLLQRWDELQPWRSRRPWLDLAVKATHHLIPVAAATARTRSKARAVR